MSTIDPAPDFLPATLAELLERSPAPDVQQLTVRDLAALLRLSDTQVRRLERAGKIPAPVLIGNALRWSLGEIREWREAGCPDRDRWEAIRAAQTNGRRASRPRVVG